MSDWKRRPNESETHPFKELGHHYKPEENKFCDECGVPVGDCVEYIGKIRCIGCWVEFDANIRPRTTHDLINILKKTLEEPYESSKVIISYSDAVCILNKLEEYEYAKNRKSGNHFEESKEELWYVVKKSFNSGDDTHFAAKTVWPERVFFKYGSDLKELLAEDYIEVLPNKRINRE